MIKQLAIEALRVAKASTLILPFSIVGAALLDVYFISELAYFSSLLLAPSVSFSEITKTFMSETLLFEQYVTFLITLAGVSYSAVLANSYLIVRNANAIGAAFGNEAIERFLEGRTFVDVESLGEYTRRLILDDMHRIVSGIYVPMYNLIARMILILCFLIYLVFESPVLTSFATAGVAVYLLFLNLGMKKLIRVPSKRLTAYAGDRINLLNSITDGHHHLTVFGKTGQFSTFFASKNTAYYKTKGDLEFITTIPRLLIEGVIVIAVLVLVLLSTANASILDLSALLIFLLSMARIAPALQQSFSLAIQARSHIPVFEELNKSERKGTAAQNQYCPLDVFQKEDSLLIKSLSIRFSEDHKIKYHNVELKRGCWNVIVGRSGLGKSTLLAYLSGYQLPLWESIKAEKYSVKNSLVYGMAAQHFVVNGTLLDNIFLELGGRPPSKDELKAAFQLLSDVELASELKINESNFLAFNLDASGGGLSVGQVQRLSLVRAFVKDPDVVLLDEPTSALNDELAKRIFKRLKNRFQNKTVICVTHSEILLSFFDMCIQLDKKAEVINA